MGRSSDFEDGAERVRQPVRVQNFRPMSNLEEVLPTGNGMSSTDRERLLYGAHDSGIGRSDSDRDKHLYLQNNQQ